MRKFLRLCLGLLGSTFFQTAFAQQAPATVEGAWTLARLSDVNGTLDLTAQAPTLVVTATDGETRVSGSNGCNTFSGSAAFTADTVRFGPLLSTLRGCQDVPNGLDARFNQILSRARGVFVSDRVLVLSTGTERLVFRRSSVALGPTGTAAASAIVATWTLLGAEGDEGPALTFDADGRVSGSTGCNSFSGAYTARGDALSFSPLATTRRACTNEILGRQETVFLQQLARVRGFA